MSWTAAPIPFRTLRGFTRVRTAVPLYPFFSALFQWTSYPAGHFTCWTSPGCALVSCRQTTSAPHPSMNRRRPFLRAARTPLTFQETIVTRSMPRARDRALEDAGDDVVAGDDQEVPEGPVLEQRVCPLARRHERDTSRPPVRQETHRPSIIGARTEPDLIDSGETFIARIHFPPERYGECQPKPRPRSETTMMATGLRLVREWIMGLGFLGRSCTARRSGPR